MGSIISIILAFFANIINFIKGRHIDIAKKLGREEVKSEVAADALKKIDEARKDKEVADEQARKSNYTDLVNRM